VPLSHHYYRFVPFLSRDIKPENILLDESGRHLKLADLGSCRGIYNKQPYTEYISTRWYRAPECLLTDGYYGPEMDIWATGCVLFEVISLYPLFPGTDELDTLNRIHKILGSPPQQVLNDLVLQGKASAHMNFDFPSQKGAGIGHLIPHAPPDCVDLLTRSLRYELKDRISARGSINHPYFSEFRDSDLESQARSCQLSRSGAGQQSTSDVERVKHTANAAYSSTASLARIATKSDPGTSSSSMPLERSQACNVPQQQHRPMLLSIETGEYAEIKKSSLSELPLPGVEEETSIPHPPPKHTAHRKKHQIPDNMSTHGTLSRKSTTDRKLTNPNTNINQASSRRSTMPGKHLAHQSIQSKSSLPALKSQRKSSLPKLGAASSSCEVSGTTKRSSHIKNTVGGSYDRRKSESSRNNSYSHVRSSGYGKSNKIPQNKRYSHITSSGYGQSTSSTHSRNSIAAGNIGAVKSGGVGARSSLPSIGQYSTRPRGVVARTGAVRIRSRT